MCVPESPRHVCAWIPPVMCVPGSPPSCVCLDPPVMCVPEPPTCAPLTCRSPNRIYSTSTNTDIVSPVSSISTTLTLPCKNPSPPLIPGEHQEPITSPYPW